MQSIATLKQMVKGFETRKENYISCMYVFQGQDRVVILNRI